MLMNLLYEISKGGAYSDAKVAKKLHTSEQMIIQMKEQLVNMGYIEEYKPCKCSGACSSCGCSCEFKEIVKIWDVTKKGKIAIERFKK
ncbi:FeoC-like transcriptional regulator [Clostridium aestuarii]|uniref:FeoC-like transcriptional regulator n=1 Tax=Clostridium aestuarii TaxID=338193 RepID=A0ABT4CZR4_9CLOT|nr:FeoC-like transcriptional regulator [Clostridium aestuarii]MCY6484471.1 FeoC-like transcriptional regulator [Clostridium aestuarii]